MAAEDWTSSPDGAWAGNQHNAIQVGDRVYFGYVDGNGNVEVRYREDGETSDPTVLLSGGDDDHHNSPAIVQADDGHLVVAYAGHLSSWLYVGRSGAANSIASFSTANIDTTLDGAAYTYAELLKLDDGDIYLFYRDGNGVGDNPTATLGMSKSTDNGATWSSPTSIYAETGGWSYWVIEADGTRIDIATSNGRPPFPGEEAEQTDYSDLYHFYIEGGSYYKTDGTEITASLPLSASDLTKVYDGFSNGQGVRAPYDILSDGPTVVFGTKHPADTEDNTYRWARWSGSAWSVETVASVGASSSVNFSEPGIALATPWQAYAGIYDDGAYKMYRLRRPWTGPELVGGGSGPEVHPIVAGDWVLWSNGPVLGALSGYGISSSVRADKVRPWTPSAVAGAQSAWPSLRP